MLVACCVTPLWAGEYDDFIAALKQKDVKKVMQLFEKNPKDPFFVYLAIDEDATEMLKLLLDHNAPISHNALTAAITKNNQEIVDMLLAHNAPINEKALGWAVVRKDKKMLRLLLAHNAPVGARALHSVIIDNDTEAVEMLLSSKNAPPVSEEMLTNARRRPEIMALLTSFVSKQDLMKLTRGIEKNTEDFIVWLKNGALTNKLSHDDIQRFAVVAFTIPSVLDTFEILLPLLVKPEDFAVFTPNIIKRGLIAHNLKAFELLLPKIAHDKDVVGMIREQAQDFLDQDFAHKILDLIKFETRKPIKRKGEDIKFSFAKF